MATSAAVIQGISQATGLRPSGIDRVVRSLRDADLVPKGGRGGGKSAAHYEVHHLANVLMALASADPINGAAAVQELRPLCRVLQLDADGRPIGPPRPDGEPKFNTFGEFMDFNIRFWANLGDRGQDRESPIFNSQSWEICLCLRPLFAVVSMDADTTQRPTAPFVFTETGTASPKLPLRRLTLLTVAPLITAANLALDTDRHRRSNDLLSEPTHANASSESKNAGDLCHKVPASSKNQPRANEAEFGDHPRLRGSGGLLGLPERICEERDFQGYACVAAGHSTNLDGVAHARSRSDPSPAISP